MFLVFVAKLGPTPFYTLFPNISPIIFGMNGVQTLQARLLASEICTIADAACKPTNRTSVVPSSLERLPGHPRTGCDRLNTFPPVCHHPLAKVTL